MRRGLLAGAALIVAVTACQKREQATPQLGASTPHPDVVLETTKGRIVLELDRNAAPKTVANFITHVDQHFYDGLVFHRVIPGFVIQAGLQRADRGQRISSAPPVPNEASNGFSNLRGSVALARTMDPQSGGVQFYINLKDNKQLDFKDSTVAGWGYCVFGRVKEGMDVADAIGRGRTRPDDSPVEPVVITRAYVDTTAASPAPSAK
jgi:peptidyl-prolyl cis-trans isomerase B (cyclophilin B)